MGRRDAGLAHLREVIADSVELMVHASAGRRGDHRRLRQEPAGHVMAAVRLNLPTVFL